MDSQKGPSPDDKVMLVVVLKSGGMCPAFLSRRYASGTMRGWFARREAALLSLMGKEVDWLQGPKEIESAEHNALTLSHGTAAVNYEYPGDKDGSHTFAGMVWAWDQVAAMYMKDLEDNPQEKIVEAINRFTDVVERQIDARDEWKYKKEGDV